MLITETEGRGVIGEEALRRTFVFTLYDSFSTYNVHKSVYYIFVSNKRLGVSHSLSICFLREERKMKIKA